MRVTYLSLSLLAASSLTLMAAKPATPAPSPASLPPLPPSPSDAGIFSDSFGDLMTAAENHINRNDWDGALTDLDTALLINPKSVPALQRRASVYVQKKLWDKAEADYNSAHDVDPKNNLLAYDAAEVQYMGRNYEKANVGFSKLLSDPQFGDLAVYKVFLCNMFSGRNDVASVQMSAMDDQRPSYYFARAVWASFSGTSPNVWLNKAGNLFGPDRYNIYITSLTEARMAMPTMMSFTAKDGHPYNSVMGYVEPDGIRVAPSQGVGGWITVPFDQLPDDISGLPPNIRDALISRKTVAAQSAPNGAVSFTTKSGKVYTNVGVESDSSGVRLDNKTEVPFADLPENIEAFPAGVRAAIQAHRYTTSNADGDRVSFSTAGGVHYDQVRVAVTPDGLRALTSDGWVTIPFDQVANPKAFPSSIQAQIQAQVKGNEADVLPDPISFTTTAGKTYTNVHVSVVTGGLAIHEGNKTETVPLSQIPKDASFLPVGVQIELAMQRDIVPVAPSSSDARVSFTTTKGRSFDDAKVALIDAGLNVLTSDGWVTVPFSQLPKDLLGFPPDLKTRIEAAESEFIGKAASTQ